MPSHGCSSLTSIGVVDGNSKYTSQDVLFDKNKTILIQFPGEKWSLHDPRQLRIGDDAFWGCISLTSVTIPDSVTSIGDYAFCIAVIV